MLSLSKTKEISSGDLIANFSCLGGSGCITNSESTNSTHQSPKSKPNSWTVSQKICANVLKMVHCLFLTENNPDGVTINQLGRLIQPTTSIKIILVALYCRLTEDFLKTFLQTYCYIKFVLQI